MKKAIQKVSEKFLNQVAVSKRKLNPDQVMAKIHQTGRKLLKENPHAYIDYSS